MNPKSWEFPGICEKYVILHPGARAEPLNEGPKGNESKLNERILLLQLSNFGDVWFETNFESRAREAYPRFSTNGELLMSKYTFQIFDASRGLVCILSEHNDIVYYNRSEVLER